MRILFVGDGGSIHIQRWIAGIRNLDRATAIGLASSSPGIELSGTGNIAIWDDFVRGPGMSTHIQRMVMASKILVDFKPDVVNIHYADVFGLYFMIPPIRERARTVLTIWGSDVFRHGRASLIRQKVVRYLLKHADAVTSSSSAALEAAEDIAGTLENAFAIPWGVDRSFFSPRIIDSGPVFEVLGRAPTPRVFLPRNAKELYRTKELIELWSESGIGGTLIVLKGNGPDDYWSSVRSLVHERGLEESVVFYPDQVSPETMRDIFCLSDVYVSWPTSDNLSHTVIEGLACGCPGIVGALPAYVPMLEGYSSGVRLVHNERDVISALRSWARDRAVAVEASRVIGTWSDTVSSTWSVFEKVLSR